MDYLKSLSSAASSVLSSSRSGPLANYTLGEELIEYRSQTIWSLYLATKRDDNTLCTVLAFDTTHPHNAHRSNLFPLAKNAARRLRTTRHPDVLRLLDSVESNTAVYIVVEKATPLKKVLAGSNGQRTTQQRQDWVTWGLSSIMNAVKFLNKHVSATHGNLRPESIFLSASGEWKLGGFETFSVHSDGSSGLLYTHASLLPDAARYVPPEVKQNGWNVLASMDSTLLDSYSLALVAIEAFNGTLPPQIGTTVPSRGHVPQALYAMLQRMLVPNAKNRLSVAKVADAGEAEGGFFRENNLVKVARGLDGFLLASENEKAAILKFLQDRPDSFPPEFLRYKVLPALVNALVYTPPAGTVACPSTQPSTLLPLVLRLGQPLPKEEWNTAVVPTIVKAYTSADRSTRMVLLENLAMYADRLENKVVVDKVWPNFITGFNDSSALIREATLKAILPLAPKLSDRILNNDLLRLLARTQVDPEAGIRTNTTILLERLVPNLSMATRKKVLIPAFSRSLKDAFVHARVAGIMALMAAGDSFDHDDAAKQILPAVTPCLVDKEKLVRDQADRAVQMFLKTVEEGRAGMPDTVLSPEQAAGIEMTGDGINSVANQTALSIAASAGSAATSLAGWAMSSALSSLSSASASESGQKSLAVSLSTAAELQSNMDGRKTPSVLTPSMQAANLSNLSLGSPSVQRAQRLSSSSSTSSLTHVSSAFANPLDYDLDENAAAGVATSTAASSTVGAQDEKDLIDVYDDSADWSTFEVGHPKKKTITVGKTKMNRSVAGGGSSAAARKTSAETKGSLQGRTSKLGTTKAIMTPGNNSSIQPILSVPVVDPKRAFTRTSLQVVDTVANEDDDDAWGNAWGERQVTTTTSSSSSSVTFTDESRIDSSMSMTAKTEVDSMTASPELTVQAFASPLLDPIVTPSSPPSADTDEHQSETIVDEPGPNTESWASFDDTENNDEWNEKKPIQTAPITMTKEEKKAELERKRLERKRRLEQLKQEKEKARVKALVG